MRFLATIATLMLVASGTHAFPSFGTMVDSSCTANAWVPAEPFNPNGGNPNDPTEADCGLCHTNALNPGGSLTPGGKTFKSSGLTDVSPFCSPFAVNTPPNFASVAPQLATVGQELRFAVTAADPEGDAIVLSAANAPPAHNFADNGDGTGTFTWTPGPADVGTHLVMFSATDNGTPMAGAMIDVSITVGVPANRPPVLDLVADQAVDPGVALTLALNAVDPDGDTLTYAYSPSLPGAMLIGSVFEWTPAVTDIGNHTVTFSATDDGVPSLSDSATAVISVGAVNRPPVLTPIGSRTVDVGEALVIVLTATDPDGDQMAFSCVGLPTDSTFMDLGDGTAEIRWAPVSSGAFMVSCEVSDGAVPPGLAGEMFAMTARDVAPPSGGPIVESAVWKARKGSLRVTGRLTGASAADRDSRRQRIELFTLLDDGSTLYLGSRRARKDGSFRVGLKPFLAPCNVGVSVEGTMGEVIPVKGAPADCAETVLTYAKAELKCEDGKIEVEGRRGPPRGMVSVSEAAGAELGSTQVRRKGEFKLKVRLASIPDELSWVAYADGHRWDISEAVRVKREDCGQRDDDDDDDDDDDHEKEEEHDDED